MFGLLHLVIWSFVSHLKMLTDDTFTLLSTTTVPWFVDSTVAFNHRLKKLICEESKKQHWYYCNA